MSVEKEKLDTKYKRLLIRKMKLEIKKFKNYRITQVYTKSKSTWLEQFLNSSLHSLNYSLNKKLNREISVEHMRFIYLTIHDVWVEAQCSPKALHEVIVPVKVPHDHSIHSLFKSWNVLPLLLHQHCEQSLPAYCGNIVQNSTGTHNVACLVWPYSEILQALESARVKAARVLLV